MGRAKTLTCGLAAVERLDPGLADLPICSDAASKVHKGAANQGLGEILAIRDQVFERGLKRQQQCYRWKQLRGWRASSSVSEELSFLSVQAEVFEAVPCLIREGRPELIKERHKTFSDPVGVAD
jgi:hypothetical protein